MKSDDGFVESASFIAVPLVLIATWEKIEKNIGRIIERTLTNYVEPFLSWAFWIAGWGIGIAAIGYGAVEFCKMVRRFLDTHRIISEDQWKELHEQITSAKSETYRLERVCSRYQDECNRLRDEIRKAKADLSKTDTGANAAIDVAIQSIVEGVI